MEVWVEKFKRYGSLTAVTVYVVHLITLLLLGCLVQGILALLLGLAVFRNPKLFWGELEDVSGLVSTITYFTNLENLKGIYKGN